MSKYVCMSVCMYLFFYISLIILGSEILYNASLILTIPSVKSKYWERERESKNKIGVRKKKTRQNTIHFIWRGSSKAKKLKRRRKKWGVGEQSHDCMFGSSFNSFYTCLIWIIMFTLCLLWLHSEYGNHATHVSADGSSVRRIVSGHHRISDCSC